MRLNSLICFVIGICSNLFGQTSYFNQLHFDQFLYASVMQKDSNYTVIGDVFTPEREIVIAKLNDQGDTIWQQIFGEAPEIHASKKVIEANNGLVMLGGKKDTANSPDADFLLAKFDFSGNNLWFHRYGGNAFDSAHDLKKTSDGGYVLAGETRSYGAGGKDFYLVKTDSLGNQEWQRTYGGGG